MYKCSVDITWLLRLATGLVLVLLRNLWLLWQSFIAIFLDYYIFYSINCKMNCLLGQKSDPWFFLERLPHHHWSRLYHAYSDNFRWASPGHHQASHHWHPILYHSEFYFTVNFNLNFISYLIDSISFSSLITGLIPFIHNEVSHFLFIPFVLLFFFVAAKMLNYLISLWF